MGEAQEQGEQWVLGQPQGQEQGFPLLLLVSHPVSVVVAGFVVVVIGLLVFYFQYCNTQ
jgi:hypothetical protein